MTLRHYVFLQYTMIKFAIHRSFFQNALVEYIGVRTDTNKGQHGFTIVTLRFVQQLM